MKLAEKEEKKEANTEFAIVYCTTWSLGTPIPVNATGITTIYIIPPPIPNNPPINPPMIPAINKKAK